MELTVNRLFNAPENATARATTTGTVSIDGVQTAFSLEPTTLMIPAGTYVLKLLPSHRFARSTPHILDVPDRTAIEVHGGNKAEDSEGCILVAEKRISDYEIFDSEPATSAIEEALRSAEANGETNTIIIQ